MTQNPVLLLDISNRNIRGKELNSFLRIWKHMDWQNRVHTWNPSVSTLLVLFCLDSCFTESNTYSHCAHLNRLRNPNYVPDEEIVKTQREKLVGVLQIYDQILGKHKYIGGDTFTMADLFHIPYLTMFVKIGESENLWKDLPNVQRWYKDISERESVKACS